MAGELSINIEVTVDEAIKEMERFRRDSSRVAAQSAESWRQILGFDSITKANLLKTSLAGLAISVGIASRSFTEWAKSSRDAASDIEGLASAWQRLKQGIGADIEGTGILPVATGLANEAANRLDVIRGTSAVGGANVFSGIVGGMSGSARAMLSGHPLSAFEMAVGGATSGFVNSTVIGMNAVNVARNATFNQRRRDEYLSQRDTYAELAMRARGDDVGVANLTLRREMADIAAQRSIASRDYGAGRERNAMLDERTNVAYATYAAALDRASEKEATIAAQARRAAEAEADRLRSAEKMRQEKQRAAQLGDQEYGFTIRALEIENMRLAGDKEGARVAEIKLDAERMRADVANRSDLTSEGRNAALRRLDEIEAFRLNLPASTASARSFMRPGITLPGVSGIRDILSQAFAPPGASGPNVEVQQLNELRQIRQAVKGGQVARLG